MKKITVLCLVPIFLCAEQEGLFNAAKGIGQSFFVGPARVAGTIAFERSNDAVSRCFFPRYAQRIEAVKRQQFTQKFCKRLDELACIINGIVCKDKSEKVFTSTTEKDMLREKTREMHLQWLSAQWYDKDPAGILKEVQKRIQFEKDMLDLEIRAKLLEGQLFCMYEFSTDMEKDPRDQFRDDWKEFCVKLKEFNAAYYFTSIKE